MGLYDEIDKSKKADITKLMKEEFCRLKDSRLNLSIICDNIDFDTNSIQHVRKKKI